MSDLEARVQVLEARLQHLEDDKAIRELLARYGYNADQGRGEAYVHLYTEDGALELSRGPGGPRYAPHIEGRSPDDEVVVRHQGHDALRDFITDPEGHKRIEGTCLHFMGNNLTTHIDGDHAVAESYNMTLLRRGSEFVLYNAAINRWTLRKLGGRWLIEECKRRRPGTKEFNSIHVTMA